MTSTEKAEIFQINPDFSTDLFLNIIFLLEDTSQAIDHFLEFGLVRNEINNNDISEKYLRLYGVLNAVNMQYIAGREIYKIYSINNLKKYTSKIKALEVMKLRHIAAAHSLDFNIEGIKDCYRISQGTLGQFGRNLHVIGEKDNNYRYNLYDSIIEFNTIIQNEFNNIVKTLILRLFDKNSSKYKELNDYLIAIEN